MDACKHTNHIRTNRTNNSSQNTSLRMKQTLTQKHNHQTNTYGRELCREMSQQLQIRVTIIKWSLKRLNIYVYIQIHTQASTFTNESLSIDYKDEVSYKLFVGLSTTAITTKHIYSKNTNKRTNKNDCYIRIWSNLLCPL